MYKCGEFLHNYNMLAPIQIESHSFQVSMQIVVLQSIRTGTNSTRAFFFLITFQKIQGVIFLGGKINTRERERERKRTSNFEGHLKFSKNSKKKSCLNNAKIAEPDQSNKQSFCKLQTFFDFFKLTQPALFFWLTFREKHQNEIFQILKFKFGQKAILCRLD